MMSQPEMPSTHISSVTQESPQGKGRGRDLYKCETTANGDVRTFVVEPSFDADENSSRQVEGTAEKEPEPSPTSQQSRSDEDDHDPSEAIEKRASPSKDDRVRTHTRDLSAHFFDATKIRDDEPQSETVPASGQDSYPVQHSRALHEKQSPSSFPSSAKARESPTPSSEGAISYSMKARAPPISPASHVGEKHRRGISGDMSSPAVAHRRINSIGNSAPVDRRGYYYHYNGSYHNASQDRQSGFPVPASRASSADAHHSREDSAGLDMLSAAIADVSKEELAVIAGPREREGPSQTPWEPPVDSSNRAGRRTQMETLRVSPTNTNSGAYEYPNHHHHGGPPPGPPPRGRGYHPSPHPPQQVFHGSSSPTNHGPPYPPPGPYHHHGPSYPPPQYHHRGMSSSPSMQQYPGQYSYPPPGSHDPYKPPQQMPMQPVMSRNMGSTERRPSPSEVNDKIDTDERLFMRASPPSTAAPNGAWPPRPVSQGGTTTAGSQTHVTAISVGDDGRTIRPTVPQRNVSTNTDPVAKESHLPSSIPSTVGHHRKMSSFSSLGTLMNSGLFSDTTDNQSTAQPAPHHRTMSSTTSFLQVLDESDPFLQSLGAPAPSSSGQSSQPYAPQPNRYTSSPTSSQSTGYSAPPHADSNSSQTAQFSGRALASGGTSKRIRRKCTVAGCPNRVVQGGLCISHGAKRKQCKHPGCTKNVKKAGLCSTHGPARKRCDTEGCTKVAVQGGKCIAHGAKKKLCAIDGCTKQAILAGMCKKHHDQQHGVVSSRGGRKTGNTLAPSEGSTSPPMCAEVGDSSKQLPAPGTGPSSSVPKGNHRRGLSIFQEMSADSVKILLSDSADDEPATPQPGVDAFTPF